MRFFIGLTLLAMVVAPAAAGHDGNGFFDTAKRTARHVDSRYDSVRATTCFRLPRALAVRHGAQAVVRDDTRYWDHFGCRLTLRGGNWCRVVVHIVGGDDHDFSTTPYPRRGCNPAALR
jgi:hypothetical protein